MRRLVDIAIDRLIVDPSVARDPAALRAAIEGALRGRLNTPGAVEALRAGHVPLSKVEARPGARSAESIGSAVAEGVLGRGP